MSTIGLDYTAAYEQGGGIGRYVRELVTALAHIDSTNSYRLFVAGASSSNLPASIAPNFGWRSTPLSPLFLARLWHRLHVPLPVEAFVGRVPLYHATDFVLPPTLPGVRTLLTVHDLSFVRVPGAASPGLRAYLDKVVPSSVARADLVLADSEATKEDLLSLYRVSSEKVVVLLSGVSSTFIRYIDPFFVLTIRKKYRLTDRPYILSIGTVQPRKNYSRLIQALALIRNQGLDLDLVIAGGKGWLEDPIYATIRETHLEDHVHFIGFADDADLPTLYNGAVCFAFPSLYEGFGLPILEAMSCGTPVVTSNISSLPEVAGDATLLIDPYDVEALSNALQRLITDTELRNTLIVKGHIQAKKFTWEKSARHLLQIYNNLLG